MFSQLNHLMAQFSLRIPVVSGIWLTSGQTHCYKCQISKSMFASKKIKSGFFSSSRYKLLINKHKAIFKDKQEQFFIVIFIDISADYYYENCVNCVIIGSMSWLRTLGSPVFLGCLGSNPSSAAHWWYNIGTSLNSLCLISSSLMGRYL